MIIIIATLAYLAFAIAVALIVGRIIKQADEQARHEQPERLRGRGEVDPSFHAAEITDAKP